VGSRREPSDRDVGSGVTLEHYAYSTAAAALRGYRRYADTEVRRACRQRAAHALASAEMRRLMTIPGVDVTTAATLIAAIGEYPPLRIGQASGSATSVWMHACTNPA